MPPFIPRKRLRSDSPEAKPSANTEKSSKKAIPSRKRTLFDELDSGFKTPQAAKKLLKRLEEDDVDDGSELSDVDDEIIEDLAPSSAKRAKLEADARTAQVKPEKKAPKAKSEVKEKKPKTALKGKRKTKAEVRTEAPAPAPTLSRRAPPRKKTLHDELDAGTSSRSPEAVKSLLKKLGGDEDDFSDASSTDSDEEFEDVTPLPASGPPPSAAPKASSAQPAVSHDTYDVGSEDEDDDEDDEFEDVDPTARLSTETLAPTTTDTQSRHGPSVYRPLDTGNDSEGDLDLTLTRDKRIPLIKTDGGNKGPSKIERGIRIATHQIHVQFLMWHNSVRNGWCCDKETQGILFKALMESKGMERVLENWRSDAGPSADEVEEKDGAAERGKSALNGKDKAEANGTPSGGRSKGDWTGEAKHASPSKPNLSRGDPLITLLTKLSKYWRQRFTITAPGLHKIGYMSLQRIDEETKSNRSDYDVRKHGERILDKTAWRNAAKEMEGSRDFGAQLFGALLRGLGLETRIVASLQPVGFGWSKGEDAAEPKERKANSKKDEDEEELSDNSEKDEKPVPRRKSASKTPAKQKITPNTKSQLAKSRRKSKVDEESDLSSLPDDEPKAEFMSDESVVAIPNPTKKKSKTYERGLPPTYWVEVLSPITSKWLPCSPFFPTDPVATTDDLISHFEPRGAKADKAKQVICYVIAFASDFTAKDVTTRYLKKHMWPGKTKGVRYPAEKVPIYDRNGKVKRYVEYDWFKTVMSGYIRRDKDRRAEDDVEDSTNLKSVKVQRVVKEGEETLQYYKSSKEFVLARHLRREEALLRPAQPVKKFVVKGKKGEHETTEDVYLRRDVVHCKSVETWHKEGRRAKLGEQPRKRVPFRAATINRKRELAEAELASGGQKLLQGLYSLDQTEWIIPPPIVDGRIPKNGYGNMDVYVPSMVPQGAVHIRLRSTKRICNKLGIDFAEAVTGFEFGARMAVPVVEGVVVAEENEALVREEWGRFEVERVRKEDEKKRKAAMGMWRKMMMGLRIVKRVKEEYGEDVPGDNEVLMSWGAGAGKSGKDSAPEEDDKAREAVDKREEEMAGGFFADGHEVEVPQRTFFPTRHDEEDEGGGGDGFDVGDSATPAQTTSSFLPTRHDNEDEDEAVGGGGFMVDEDETADTVTVAAETTAVSPSAKLVRTDSGRRINEMPAISDVEMDDVPQQEREALEPEPQRRTAARRQRGGAAAKGRTSGRGKQAAAAASESEDEDEDVQMLDAEEEEEKPKRMRPARGVRKAAAETVKESPATRKVPVRRAARKSTGVKSRYFEGEDEDDSEEID